MYEPVTLTDVIQRRERRTAANLQTRIWRPSIVDLLRLLDMDRSSARNELASNWDAWRKLTGDSPMMNIWLYQIVHTRIAAHSGDVPTGLLH